MVAGSDTGTAFGAYRSEAEYQSIVDALELRGIKLNIQQCQDKIKALKKKYKKIIDKLRQSGVGVDSDEDVEVWHKWNRFELLH